MSIQFKRYKRIFRLNLQPVFAMLISKKNAMSMEAWEELVKNTIGSIHHKPVEYLGNNLPEPSLLSDILNEILHEFLKETRTFRNIHH